MASESTTRGDRRAGRRRRTGAGRVLLAAWLAHAGAVAEARAQSPRPGETPAEGVTGGVAAATAVAAGDEAKWGHGWSDRSRHRRPVQIAAMALLYGSFTDVVVGPRHNVFGPGLGLRVTLPLLGDGWLPSHNDSFDLEVGVDVYAGIPDRYHPDSYVGVVPDASLRWTFYVGRTSAVYVKAGGQLDIGVQRPWWPAFAWPSGSVGGLFAVRPGLDVKVELGWPAVRAGVAFDAW